MNQIKNINFKIKNNNLTIKTISQEFEFRSFYIFLNAPSKFIYGIFFFPSNARMPHPLYRYIS